jgi:hypothetical protein
VSALAIASLRASEEDTNLPWTGKTFASRHNKSLSSGEAAKAASQASAMVKAGVPDGIAIATANKHINKLRKRGMISDRARSKMPEKWGKDPDGINAATA